MVARLARFATRREKEKKKELLHPVAVRSSVELSVVTCSVHCKILTECTPHQIFTNCVVIEQRDSLAVILTKRDVAKGHLSG